MFKQKKTYRIIVAALIGAAFMILTAAPAFADDAPVDAFRKLGKAADNGDWGTFWDGCEESTQQTMGRIFLFIVALGSIDNPDLQKKLEAEIGPPPDDPKKAVITRDQFIKIMAMMKEMDEEDDDVKEFFTDSKVEERSGRKRKPSSWSRRKARPRRRSSCCSRAAPGSSSWPTRLTRGPSPRPARRLRQKKRRPAVRPVTTKPPKPRIF